MDVEVQGKTVELDDRVRDQITKKLDRLGRHVPGVAAATVELSMENTKGKDQRVVVQVTLDINGTDLRSEEKGANTMAAVNAVTDVLDRRVERYKSRSYRSAQAKKPGKNVSIRTIDAPNDLAEVVPVSEGTYRIPRGRGPGKAFPYQTYDGGRYSLSDGVARPLFLHVFGQRDCPAQPSVQAPRWRLRTDPARTPFRPNTYFLYSLLACWLSVLPNPRKG